MIKKWKFKHAETVFKKYSRRIDRIDYELPGGRVSDYYIKVEGPACSVLGITVDNQIILVKQYRPGPDEILYELPGGFIDPGEKALDAVEREFLEETGYKGNLEKISVAYDDAYSTMQRYCYVAKDCRKIQEPVQSDEESVEVVLESLADFRKRLQSGKMTDIEVGYLGLDHLELL